MGERGIDPRREDSVLNALVALGTQLRTAGEILLVVLYVYHLHILTRACTPVNNRKRTRAQDLVRHHNMRYRIKLRRLSTAGKT